MPTRRVRQHFEEENLSEMTTDAPAEEYLATPFSSTLPDIEEDTSGCKAAHEYVKESTGPIAPFGVNTSTQKQDVRFAVPSGW